MSGAENRVVENRVVENIKRLTQELLDYLTDNVPAGRERSLAATHYQMGLMWVKERRHDDNDRANEIIAID